MTETAKTDDPQKHCARRVKKDGRVVVLPPDGHGTVWNGSAQ